ncbi:MAG: histidine phosphatase family protein [Acidobacteria bacterium]|nr:MAG: histidine phosphatase family protein [Acidobacteriota bacterium]
MMTRRLTGALFVAMTLVPSISFAQRMVILTRHAERADGAATMGPSDPLLSAAGKARAEKLAAMLLDANIAAIFTTEFHRTIDTAAPLAAKIKVAPEVVTNAQMTSLIDKIRSRADDTVFVVGHSNTVPMIIKALGGPDITIGDNEYDNLFFYVPATKTLTRVRY